MWVTWPPPKPPPHCMSKKHFGKWLWKDQKPRVVYQNCYDSWGWHDFSIIFYPPPWSPRFLPLFSTLNGQLVSLPTGWKQWNHGGDQLQLWDLHSSSRLSLKNGPKPSGKRAETNHPIVQGLFFLFQGGYWFILWSSITWFYWSSYHHHKKFWKQNSLQCLHKVFNIFSFDLKRFSLNDFFRSNTNYLAWTLAEQVIW